jgi:molybdenum cofactor guanylyltransferase
MRSSQPFPVSAFLLAGGESRRMGRDKALLPVGGQPLLLHLAQSAAPVVNSIAVIAPPGRYEALCEPLGLVVLPDLRPGSGPLAGIEAALARSQSDWNLILACDMPFVDSAWLATLVAAALGQHADVLCVASALGTEEAPQPSPLCACWHKDALPAVSRALDQGQRRVRDLLPVLNTRYLFPVQPRLLANWNSPTDVDD